MSHQPAAARDALVASIADAAGFGIAAVDAQGRQIYVNRAFCEMLGYEADELLGQMPPFSYWALEDLDRIQSALALALAGQFPAAGVELKFRCKDQSRIPVLVRVTPRETNGTACDWVATVTDLQHIARNRDALRQSEALFRTMVEGMGETFYSTDEAFTALRHVSASIETLTGYPPKAFYEDASFWMKLVAPEHLEEMARAAEILSRGTPLCRKYQIIRADGTRRWVRDNTYAVRGSAASPGLVVGIVADITDQKIAEDRLKLSELRLREAQSVGKIGS